MKSDKELKKEFKEIASKDPDKYYATAFLKKQGYVRNKCIKCGTYFWSTDSSRKVCGDSSCSNGFTFFGKKVSKKPLSYAQVWQEFSQMFKSFGYTPIKRYPVVARWNKTMDFTIASIAAFQPYVVSGEVKPPANPLVIPQFCLRFGDIDNVGITGSHMTGFVMIGQHMFVSPEQWDQEKVFNHIFTWLTKGLEIPKQEIIFHEDAWAGGGNFGPCMEYFSHGLELGNQVYMMFELDNGKPKDLKLKVLDMGMGHERIAWFTQGTNTIYEAAFPYVIKKLIKATNISYDHNFMRKFAPYAGMLNIDEVKDINIAWKNVAEKINTDEKTLKQKIMPLTALFSIAEHTRSLLFALNDGALPSNVGGGYNLRVLIRRSLQFIDKFKWNIKLSDVCRWHAEELKPLFPELSESLDEIEKILDVELKKYNATKEKISSIIKSLDKNITEKDLLRLYDSNGISPELIKQELGDKIKIPDDFYKKVTLLHEKKEQEHSTTKSEKLPLGNVPETKALYFDDYSKTEFKAKVIKIIGRSIILDQTLFYPTSGGQMHDIGVLMHNNKKYDVVDVFKQDAVIVHTITQDPEFNVNDEISGKIDFSTRKQLAQHHTATHIVNAAARIILGKHINQAGAKKTKEKAHLDITHYQSLSDKELKLIEDKANEIINKAIPIISRFMPRDEAEKKYGMGIYQGGAVPGKNIRIVEINGIDTEACAGTHLHNTKEVGKIKILKSTKIQDGIIRIFFTAGNAAEKTELNEKAIVLDAAKLLGIKPSSLPEASLILFEKWKTARKALKKSRKITINDLKLNFPKQPDKETNFKKVLSETAKALKTQPESLPRTISRFKKDLDIFIQKLREKGLLED